jgi:hypothetical protein
MFNNESWLKHQEQIGLKIKQLEELLIALTTKELSKDLNLSKADWIARRQLSATRLQKTFEKTVRGAYKDVHKIAEEGIKYSIDESTKELIEAVGESAKSKIQDQTQTQLKVGLEHMDEKISNDLNMLYNMAVRDFKSTIPKVELDNRGLLEVIESYTRDKSDKGYVVYQNGRKVSYKSYIEMSVRTEMQQNALTNLEASSKAAGVEFYIASAHSDCADDHADFQGYYYLADGVVWKEEWNKHKFHPKYKYLSEVKALGFLTRPNCRHYVMPVTLDQIEQKKSMHRQLGMPNRKQNPNHYKNLQKQRYNERMIRKYSSRVNNDKLMLDNAKTPEQRARIRGKLAKDRALAKKWRSENKKFTQRNYLDRDTKRERPGIVVNDIGVKLKKLNV